MNRLKLAMPTIKHKEAVVNFKNEFLAANERISGGVGLEQAENYEDWLSCKYTPHYGRVKERVFLAFDEQNNLVGISDIRLEENDFIKTYAGQIGYSICPSQRKKGYATELLRLTLKKAAHLGYNKILITCNETNIASAKVIEKNGGILEKIIPHHGFPNVKRYYIDLADFR